MGIYAMEKGKRAAIEVPAALTLEEIWDLINTSEKTRKHCMMLENCVYDFFEMNTLNMAQRRVCSASLVHTEGAYIHNLDRSGLPMRTTWRLVQPGERRGDVYPTVLGPACQLLDIHRGDRRTTLVAMDTKPSPVRPHGKRCSATRPAHLANGDHTMTMIRTTNGKTIQIQHDVMNPRPYSRMYQLTGTKASPTSIPYRSMPFEVEQLDSAPPSSRPSRTSRPTAPSRPLAAGRTGGEIRSPDPQQSWAT